MKLTKQLLFKLITETMEKVTPKDLRDHLDNINIDTSHISEDDWEMIYGYLDGVETIEDIRTFDHILTLSYGIPEGVIEDYYSAAGFDRDEYIDTEDHGYSLGKWDEEEPTSTASRVEVWKYLSELVNNEEVLAFQKSNNLRRWRANIGGSKVPPQSWNEKILFADIAVWTQKDSDGSAVGTQVVAHPDGSTPLIRLKPSEFKRDGYGDEKYANLPEFDSWVDDHRWPITGNQEEDVATLLKALELTVKLEPLVGPRRQRKFLKDPERFLKSDFRRGVLSTIGFE
tara:strand:+ start:1117 stop:1971 length:855 start_codon:yes stop_codon:yes gene_type:complete